MQDIQKLIVLEYGREKRSCVFLHPGTMGKLCMDYGGIAILKGRNKNEATCLLLRDDTISERAIGINRAIRYHLQVVVGDIVSIAECPIHLLSIREADVGQSKDSNYPRLRKDYEIRYDVIREIREFSSIGV